MERSNLSLRMGIRRFKRLTNGFSKKWEYHWAAVAVWVHVLQLLPRSQIASHDARDGCGDRGSHLEREGTAVGNTLENRSILREVQGIGGATVPGYRAIVF